MPFCRTLCLHTCIDLRFKLNAVFNMHGQPGGVHTIPSHPSHPPTSPLPSRMCTFSGMPKAQQSTYRLAAAPQLPRALTLAAHQAHATEGKVAKSYITTCSTAGAPGELHPTHRSETSSRLCCQPTVPNTDVRSGTYSLKTGQCDARVSTALILTV